MRIPVSPTLAQRDLDPPPVSQLKSPFEEEFRAFALAEARVPPPRNAVLFYGSSSIRLWDTLAADFPGLPAINRGFGGSTLAECVREMERLVFPLQPRAIVLYAGDNDLDHGATPEQVQKLFQEFMRRLEERLGAVPVVLISIKPSPARLANLSNIRRANTLLRESTATWPQVRWLELFSLMLHPDGKVRREFFTGDGVHLSRAGYRLWADQLRAVLAETGLPR
ncbi:MAG: hypothetical protein QOE70_5180 [Chthoniobacter sp.]|jgi:lysophospholipase L1-like esterase|nr:hypothetical protein [Chthoniobacter sp.]